MDKEHCLRFCYSQPPLPQYKYSGQTLWARPETLCYSKASAIPSDRFSRASQDSMPSV